MSTAFAGRGEPDLLRALYDQHAAALLYYVVGLTGGDRYTAQDVVQETLLRAWRNPAVLERIDGSSGGWLFTVARHVVIDQWRAARRRPEVVTDQLPAQPGEDTAEQTVNRHVVLTALRTLSPDHRRVLIECYVRGASTAQAAQTLGVPQGTIKSRTHYALHALRQAIDDSGGIA